MKVLFLCVANSARSQMAEGLARHLFDARTVVLSAGSEPTSVNPHAVEAMKKIGIDIKNHASKAISDVLTDDVDVVVTLCADEVCPVVPGSTQKEHWPFPDPAAAGGSDSDIASAFERVRDQIKARLVEFGKRKGMLKEDCP